VPKKIKITVITPSYNQGKFLEETILSVVSQDYKDVEHFVIDGGSTDDSVAIIKRHEKKLAGWISEKDRGQSHAINKGLKMATGEIVMWLNSDDVLLPGALQTAANYFSKHPDVDLIHGKSILFGDNYKEKIIGKRTKDLKVKYLAYIPFPQPSSFFRKSVIDSTGLLDESLHYGMDYELLARIALQSRILYVDHLFSKYRLHPDSKTGNNEKFLKDWNRIFSRVLNSLPGSEKYIESFKELNMYFAPEKKYTVKNTFSPHQIEKAFLYHLLVNLHYHYSDLNKKAVNEISAVLKKISPPFYKQNKIGAVQLKSLLLNRQLINFARNFTRK
jgi:glycosyltransferase involved in cell wall biosynthesis